MSNSRAVALSLPRVDNGLMRGWFIIHNQATAVGRPIRPDQNRREHLSHCQERLAWVDLRRSGVHPAGHDGMRDWHEVVVPCRQELP